MCISDNAKTFDSKINELSELLSDYDRVMSEWEQWVDDRDLDLQFNWEIEDYDWTSKQARSLSLNLDVCWLKMRYTLICQLSAFSCCVCSSVNFTTTEALLDLVSKMASDHRSALSEGVSVVEKVTSTKMFTYFRNHPFSPFTSPVVQFYSLKIDSFYQSLSSCITFILCDDSTNDAHCQKLQNVNQFDNLLLSIQRFQEYIASFKEKSTFVICSESNLLNAEDLISLQLIFEASSICCVILDTFARMKKSPTKASKCPPDDRREKFVNIDLKPLHAALSDVFANMELQLDELLNRILSTEWNHPRHADLVRNNFSSALNQIKTFCKAKTKYLQNLKL